MSVDAIQMLLERITRAEAAIERLRRIEVPSASPIGEVILGSVATTIGIANIPAVQKHLRITALVRNSGAAGSVGLRFNADTASHYSRANAFAIGSTTWSVQDSGVAATYAWVGSTTASTATAGSFGMIEIMIPYYADAAKRKIGLYRWGLQSSAAATSFEIGIGEVYWDQTAAINRVDLFNPSGGSNFEVGSSLTVEVTNG